MNTARTTPARAVSPPTVRSGGAAPSTPTPPAALQLLTVVGVVGMAGALVYAALTLGVVSVTVGMLA